MNLQKILKSVLLFGVILVTLLISFGIPDNLERHNETVFSLVVPPSINIARAETNDIGQILDQEAGISAYFQAPFAIDLNDVVGLYTTIEDQTPDYIIGSMPVPGYPETEDVHAYVHVNGWVLVYYFNTEPAGKIFNWFPYNGIQIETTRLEDVLQVIASAIGSPFPGATYYDFRYPNATNMMLIADATYAGQNDSYQVNLPSSNGYFHRSWSFFSDGTNGCSGYAPGRYFIDGVELEEFDVCGDVVNYSDGELQASSMPPNTYIDFSITLNGWGEKAFGGLVIIYYQP